MKGSRFSTGSKSGYILLVIFLMALCLRLIYVGCVVKTLPPDTDGYRTIAENLLSGAGFSWEPPTPTAYRPPGYPLFLAGAFKLFGSRWAPLYLQCLLGALIVFPVARLARILIGDLFALASCIIVAVDPFQIAVCGQFMTEALFGLLVALSLALFMRALRARLPGRYALAGLVAGLAALTRPEYLLFFPVALLAAWLVGRRRRKFLCILLLAVGLALPVLAWGARNQKALGSWVFTTTHGGYTHLLPYNEVFYHEVVAGDSPTWRPESLTVWQVSLAAETVNLSEIQRDRFYYRKAGHFIRKNPVRAMHVAAFEAHRFWTAFPHNAPPKLRFALGAFYIFLIALAVAGAFVAWKRTPLVPLIAYLLVAETLLHAYYWSNIRMRVPFHPLLAVLAAAGVAVLFGRAALIGEFAETAKEDPLVSPVV